MQVETKKKQVAEKRAKRLLDKPGTMLYPVPAVLVSCGENGRDNLITVAWTGIVNSEPPILYISVRRSRHSHGIIRRTGVFVVNIPGEDLVRATDFCGVRSGRDLDKFEALGLTKAPASQVDCPLVVEAPVHLECRVRDVLEFPSHDMFLADIVAVQADERLFEASGKLALEKANLLCYSHGGYFGLRDRSLGRFGFSVMKPATIRKKRKAVRPKRT